MSELTERPISEMSDDEIIAAIEKLRERRAQARERRIVEKTAEGEKKSKPKEAAVSDSLWDILSGPTEESDEKV